MKHLSIPKIGFGILITLLLAFSAQNTIDALTFSTSRSGDLETKQPNEQFTIGFSVSLKSNTAIRNSNGDPITEGNHLIDSSGYRIDPNGNRYNAVESNDGTLTRGNTPIDTSGFELDPKNGNRVTTHIDKNSDGDVDSGETFYNLVDTAGKVILVDSSRYAVDAISGERKVPADRPTPAKQFKVSDAVRYHYSSEGIKVEVTGNAQIVKVGSRTINTTQTLMMYERSHASYNTAAEHQKLSGSVTLVLEPTNVNGGIITVKVTDETPSEDAPTHGKSPPITFTLYSVKYQSNISGQNSTTILDTNTDGVEYAFENDVRPLGDYFTFQKDAQVPVNYSIEGSGTLSIIQGYQDGSPDSVKTASKTLSTSSEAPVFIDMRRGTNKVTAWVSGDTLTPKTVIFMFQGTTLSQSTSIEITGGNNQVGATGGRLEDPLAVKVTDGNNQPLAGLAVAFTSSQTDSKFLPVPGTTVYTATSNVDLVDNTANTTEASPNKPGAQKDLWVQTDSSGVAEVYYQLDSTAGDKQVTATVQGQLSLTKGFDAVADDDARRASLQIVSTEEATGTGKEGIYYLSVITRSVGGHRIPNVIIEFEALSGTLRPRPGTSSDPGSPTSGNEIRVTTGSDGEAEVEYNVGPTDSTKIVTAEVHDEQSANLEYDFILDRVTFDVQNATASRPDTSVDDGAGAADPFDPLTLTVSPTSLIGQPGSTQEITITASQTAQVGNIVFGDFLNAGGSASPSSSSGTFTATLTLPSTEGTYNLVVSMGSTRRIVSVTVSSTAAGTSTGGTLRIAVEPFTGAPGTQATVTVTADAHTTVNLSATGGTLARSSVTTDANGRATVALARGSTEGTENYVTASAPGVDSVQTRFLIASTSPDTPAPRAAGEADAIDVYDGNNQRGIPNTRLSEPLIVEVVDANNTPVANERVTFRATRGSGRFAPERPRTNASGRAQTRFTPTSSGDIRIAASVEGIASRAVFTVTAGEAPASLTKVSGDSQSGTPGSALANPFVVEAQDEEGEVIKGIRVTFSVTAGGGSLSETSATTDEDGHAGTTLTLGSQAGINSVQASVSGVDSVTFNTSIEPEILVAAANRPVMYWIDTGVLYRLAGAKATQIAENVNDVAVGRDKLYWTSQTGASAGTIHSANLDGTGATLLTTIMAVPMGIAVDTAGSKLYWTNSRGRIQRASLNGSGIQNVVQNLSAPRDIVLHGGYIYWTEGGTSIRRVNMSGQKQTQDVAVNLDTLGGLAVGGGKLYWTEQTGASSGTINGAELDGTQFATLATLQSAPMGIAVDTAGSQLYWTNSRGRVQSGNLNGSGIKNLVTGLISPSQLIIGGANTDTETVMKQPTQPAKKDTSAYDVNGDGTVDNTDASLVAAAMGTSEAKYDVDRSGTVDFLDLLLVFDNRDDAAAGAPTVVGMKLSAVQRDVLEAQIELLIATGDRSPAAMRTLVYLQQLLATARPEKTQVLANYPNPFNPETWIPYQLARDTTVKITIYTPQGVVIRTLELGHQSAGYYTGRDRAAYWDGRNAQGEQVASGVYFYQFETDDLSSLRKMVILK